MHLILTSFRVNLGDALPMPTTFTYRKQRDTTQEISTKQSIDNDRDA